MSLAKEDGNREDENLMILVVWKRREVCMEQRWEKGGEKWQGGGLLESHYLTPTLFPPSQKGEIGSKEPRNWPAFILCLL